MRRDGEAFVRIDTAKERNAVAIAEGGRRGEIRYPHEVDNTPATIAKPVHKMVERYETVCFCYEAGPAGYGLYRPVLLRLGSRQRITYNSRAARPCLPLLQL
jgi:hypothetical protein